MIAGNFSVVFKVIARGQSVAIKCFTRRDVCSLERYGRIADWLVHNDDELSPFGKFQFLEREICVFDDNGREMTLPIVVMEWLEGETLGSAFRRALRMKNIDKLNALASEFDRVVIWLQSRGCAHGDLKFDNIMLLYSGRMMLVDYDGMFVPGMENLPSGELGTRDFQHPLRDKLVFGHRMDDYSAVLISTMLHAAADMPDLFEEYLDTEQPLLKAEDVLYRDDSLFDSIINRWLSLGRTHLVRLAMELKSPVPEIDNLLDIFTHLDNALRHPTGTIRVFSLDGKFGFEDDKGVLIAPIFTLADEFCGKFAIVRFCGRELIINRLGRVVCDVSEFKNVEMLEEGVVKGWIDAMHFETLYITDEDCSCQ